jgi:flagellar motor protein MotB
VKTGDSVVDVEVPYVAEGYTVHVYNVNDSGVSAGAVVGSSTSRTSTVGFRDAQGLPRLLGTPVAKPVAFAQDSATLDATGKQQLRKVAATAKAQNRRLLITGFSSNGTGESTSISTSRAKAVADYLSQQGVRVWMQYWGAGKASVKGLASDRRVEIRTLGSAQSA